MIKEKKTVFRNGQKQEISVPKKGTDLIESRILELKEKLITEGLSENETSELSMLSGNDADSVKTIKELTAGIASLVEHVGTIAQAMANQGAEQPAS